jgi:hypothetical protein
VRAYMRPGNILYVFAEVEGEAEQLALWKDAYLQFDGTALLQINTEFDPIGLDAAKREKEVGR